MPAAFSRPTSPGQELDKKSPAQQKTFLTKYKDKSKREKVLPNLQNVKKGDILVQKGSLSDLSSYEHYRLCSDVKYSADGKIYKIEVVEYTGDFGPSANLLGYLRLGSADLTGLGKIKVNTYTEEKLKAKGALYKEVWPKELERFDVEEVIRRAKSRVGESWYDVLKNNCEHFVMWSKCGLNVSLQVDSWYMWLREVLYSFVAGGKEVITQEFAKKLVPFLIRVLHNASNTLRGWADKEFITQVAEKLFKYLGVSLGSDIKTFANTADKYLSRLLRGFANGTDELARVLSKEYSATIVGFVIGMVIEGGVGYYEIKKALKKREEGLIESDELLRAKTVEIVAKGVCRSSLGIAGSVVGSMLGGPGGSRIGGAIGGAAGHLLGFSTGWCYENRQYLDG